MKKGFAIIALLLFALPAFGQEGLIDRMASLERNTNALNALAARMKSDNEHLNERLDKLESKIDALAKSVGTSFTTSAPNWAGERTISAAGQPVASAPVMYSSYSMMGSSAGRRGVFGRRGGSGGG